MRVLVLSHTGELVGGAERSLLDELDVLEAKHAVTPSFILREPLGSMVHELRRRHWPFYPLMFTFWCWPPRERRSEEILFQSRENRRAVAVIEQLISRTRPDIVLTNTIVSPWAALAARTQHVPHVWFVREYGGPQHGLAFEMPAEAIYRDVGNLSNLVVANSETLAGYIRRHVDAAKVTTLYNPFDLEGMAQRAAARVVDPFQRRDSLKLIMTGNIYEGKGQLEGVEALAELDRAGYSAELCLVGKVFDQHYHREIRGTIRKFGLDDRVHLVGLKSDALPFVALADVGVIASREEAFGRTTFEYMALGKPTVGANSGATPELVEDGVNGYLYPPGDAKALASKLAQYVQDATLLTNHGAAAKTRAEAMMNGKWSIDALYESLQVVAAGRGEPKAESIQFLDHWLDQHRHAERVVRAPRQRSLRHRLRRIARHNYYRARKVRAALSGK